MLSILYVSVMMLIFYIVFNSTGDATELWILVRIHITNKRYQLNSHNTSDRLDSQTPSDIGATCIELVSKSLDCFTVRLFHSATTFFMLHVFVVWNFIRLITKMKIFCAWVLAVVWGWHSAPMYLQFRAVYWSIGRRG